MYISMKLPECEKVSVPDNLDLTWHARLAINGLLGTCDPKLYYEPYFLTYYSAGQPYFIHYGSQVSGVQPKYLEALALMKCMTGASDIAHESGFLQSILDNLEEDGLMYDRALPERPWNVGVGYGKKDWNVDYANVAGNGRLLNGMWYYYQLTGDEIWKKSMRRLAEKLHEIIIQKGDYAYIPNPGCGNEFSWVKGGWPNTDEPGGPNEGVEGATVFYQAQAIRGLMKWYQVSGDERMLELSRRLAKFCMQAKFYGASEMDPEVGAEKGHTRGHLHANMAAFRGILDYATIAGDIQALEFVRNGFEWIKDSMATQLGYNNFYEGCCTGDFPALGIALTDAGVGDYWDDVDYAVRNALTQMQVKDADALRAVSENFADRPVNSRWFAYDDMRYGRQVAMEPMPGLEDTADVIERSIGGMANFFHGGKYQTPHQMSCCTANGNQGFYYAWESAIRHSAGSSTVNLFYTRFSPWMDLISFLPYEGKVVIHNRGSKRINVRIPGWVLLSDVRAKVNGNIIAPDYSGRYLSLCGLSGAEDIEITFPQPKRSLKILMPDYNYRAWQGRTRVEANFIGSTCTGFAGEDESIDGGNPVMVKLFESPGYYKDFRDGKLSMKETDAYAADKIIKWY